MKTNTKVIVISLNSYYCGLSLRKVAEQIENIFEGHISQSTIHYWVHKFARLAKEYADTLKPELGGKYHHVETGIKGGGEDLYFWETIDEDTCFIVANLLSESRSSEDAIKIFRQALENSVLPHFLQMVRLH